MPSKVSKHNTSTPILHAHQLMPKEKKSIGILNERASYLATPKHDNKDSAGLISYIKFRLGANEYYGISYEYANEVIQQVIPTKVPFVPSYIAGVINHRGALLAVFDLKQLFHTQRTPDNNTEIILVTNNNMTVGFLTDGIQGSDAYDPDELDQTLSSDMNTKSNYIVGLHQGVTAIMNVEAILAHAK